MSISDIYIENLAMPFRDDRDQQTYLLYKELLKTVRSRAQAYQNIKEAL